MKKIVLIAFDDNYSVPAEVWLYNLARVTAPEVRHEIVIRIAYCVAELTEQNQARIRKLANALELEVEFVAFGTSEVSWKVTGVADYLTWTSWLRVAFFCEATEPFVYFDVDTLLLPGWEKMFDFLHLLTANDMIILASKELNPPQNYLPLMSDGVLSQSSKNGNYFNSGVLGMNPNGWDLRQTFDQCMDQWISLSQRGCKWTDQDLLNYLFSDKTMLMNEDWNHSANDPRMWEVSRRLSSLSQPKVIHFKSYKPWNMSNHLKEEFTLNQLSKECNNPYQLAQQLYFFIEHNYRVFRKYSNL